MYLQRGVKWPWQQKARDLSCELLMYFKTDESRTMGFSEEHACSAVWNFSSGEVGVLEETWH